MERRKDSNRVAAELADLQQDEKSCYFKQEYLWSYIHDPDLSGFLIQGCDECTEFPNDCENYITREQFGRKSKLDHYVSKESIGKQLVLKV